MDPRQLETIVQRMIDAGEPEENIAAVIQHASAQTAPTMGIGAPGLVAAGADALVRPAVGAVAGVIAKSPIAQKLAAQGIQSTIGGMTGGPVGAVIGAAGRIPGVRLDKGVGAVAGKVAAAAGHSAPAGVLSRLLGPVSMLLEQRGDRAPGLDPAANQRRADEAYRAILLAEMQKRQARLTATDINLPSIR